MDIEATEATPTDTGAEAESQSAEVGWTEGEGSTGADTQEEQAAESEGGEDDESQESGTAESGAEENKDRGSHQKTLEERVRELSEKRVAEAEARLAKMEAQLKERFEEPPDFVDVDPNAYKNYVNELLERAEDLRLEGNRMEAFEIEEQVRKIKAAYATNEEKRKAWLERKERAQQQQQQSEESNRQMNAAIAEASKLIQKDMKINDEAWASGEKWFMEQRKADPVLDAEYRERCWHEGPVRALKWAAGYVQAEMGKAAETAKAKKEAAKEKQVGGSADTKASSFDSVKSWNDLMKLHSKDINRYAKENPKKFTELKKRHFNK